MKKTDNRITKRVIIDEKPMRPPVIEDYGWDDGYADIHHNHNNEYCPPVPPRPVPPAPPKPEIYFGDGLEVRGNTVSVKVDDHSGNYMCVSRKGLSVEPLLRQIGKMSQIINRLEKRLTDAESDINKLKRQARPEVLTQTIVSKSESFQLGENGKIGIKTNDGIKIGDNGYLQINGDESLLVGDDGKVGVDYDGDTLDLVTDSDGNQRLSTVSSDWVLGDWNTETEEDGD